MLLSLMTVSMALAQKESPYSSEKQERVWTKRKAWFNIAYNKQSLKTNECNVWQHSDWGMGISTGRTFYLHKRPILGLMKFGLDWTYFDLNVASYAKLPYEYNEGFYPNEEEGFSYGEEGDEESSDLYKGEAGMMFGPSLTVNPVDVLKVAIYFRVLPCYSMIYNDGFQGKYATYFTYGASISWRVISLGIEQRWGDTKLDCGFDGEKSSDVTFSAKGLRFYLSFRF